MAGTSTQVTKIDNSYKKEIVNAHIVSNFTTVKYLEDKIVGNEAVKVEVETPHTNIKGWVYVTVSIIFIIIWVLLLVIITKIGNASRLGSRFQEECGKEYMERETARYYIYKAFTEDGGNGIVQGSFKAIGALLFLIICIILFFITFEYNVVNSAVENVLNKSSTVNVIKQLGESLWKFTPNDTSKQTPYWIHIFNITGTDPTTLAGKWYVYYPFMGYFVPWALTSIFYIVVISMFITYLSLVYNTRRSKLVNRNGTSDKDEAMRGVFWTGFSLCALYCMSLIYIYSYYKIRTNIILLSILLIVMLLAFYYITRYYNNWRYRAITIYDDIKNDLNNSIKEIVNSNDIEKANIKNDMTNYIARNIRLTFPDDKNVINTINKYADEYYSFMMHTLDNKDNDESDKINVGTLKKLLNKYMNHSINTSNVSVYENSLRTISDLGASLDDLTNIQTSDFHIELRQHLVDCIYKQVIDNPTQLQNVTIKDDKIKEVIRIYTFTESESKLNLREVINSNVTTTNIHEFLIFNDPNGNVNASFSLPSCMKILDGQLNTKISDSNTKNVISSTTELNDLLNCFLWKVDIYDKKAIRISQLKSDLQSVLEKYSYNGTVTFHKLVTYVIKTLDKYKESLSNPTSKIRDGLSKLRENDRRIKYHTNMLINGVFWFSFIIISIFLFVIFHILYVLNRENFSILICCIVILLFVCVTLYSWMIGNLK